jgi:hypothetical protein
MVRYEHTEVGRVLKVVLVGTVVLMLASFTPMLLEVISGRSHPGVLAIVVMPLIITSIVLPGITKLQVRLCEETLEVRMGMFTKKIALRDVTNIGIVSVPWYAGWGLRYSLNGGELWRVNGTQAIKLGLQNRSSFSLGLSTPESLETVSQKLIQAQSDSTFGHSASKRTP